MAYTRENVITSKVSGIDKTVFLSKIFRTLNNEKRKNTHKT